MVGCKFEFTVKFDNIFEVDGFVNREFLGFRKDVTLVVDLSNFNKDNLLNTLSSYNYVSDVHWKNENELFVIMEDVEERFFLDQACEIIDVLSNYFGGNIVEVSVTVSKEADVKNMDSFVKDIYRGLEHWNFMRIIDCIEKAKV